MSRSDTEALNYKEVTNQIEKRRIAFMAIYLVLFLALIYVWQNIAPIATTLVLLFLPAITMFAYSFYNRIVSTTTRNSNG